MILKKSSYYKKPKMLAGKIYPKICVIISSGQKILNGATALSYTKFHIKKSVRFKSFIQSL